jgi:UDP-N-acetylglucosamine:LPS N-acetylglucosamine transferase
MRNHQHFNAEAFASKGAADEGIQAKLSPRQICRYLLNRYDNPDRLAEMGSRMASMATLDAAEKVSDMITDGK